MSDNWARLIERYEPLIGREYCNDKGEVFKFIGLIHARDDYYYGLTQDGRLGMYSCVGSIEDFGFSKVMC